MGGGDMTRAEAFDVLGLSADASRDEIGIAYRELAQMLHPDRFADNDKLRARAERQMRRINEARDVLLKGSSRASFRTRRPRTSPATPAEIVFEARARAHAAETVRLQVVAQLRTMRERRRSMAGLALVAGLVALLCSRMRGGLGMLIFSIASMLVVWGVVDVVSLSNQVKALEKRSRELIRTRDAATNIANEAEEL